MPFLTSLSNVNASLFRQAITLHQIGQLDEVERLYRRILDIDHRHHGALHFLGMVAFARNDLSQAVSLIEQSLKICDHEAVYFNNYGVVLKELNRDQDAFDAFNRALTLDPHYADALSNLGLISIRLGLPCQQTENYFQAALAVSPDHPDALRHFSTFLVQHEHYSDALRLVERMAQITPGNANLEHRLACLYGDCGHVPEAKEHFRKAASLSGGKTVWKWKHLWHCPTFFENSDQIDEYWKNLNDDLDAALEEKPFYDWRLLPYDGFTHSFHLPHHNRSCKSVLEKFARLFASSFPFERPNYKPSEKIRVGFLVTPGHEGGFLRLTAGLIEGLDPKKFEVVLLYQETTKDKFEGRFQRPDLVRHPYSQYFEQAVQEIRSLQCDVIYYWKVGADTWSFFLPMCRLAPVQCTSWSTHGTSGLDQIDYYVSWKKAEIPEAQEDYTEKH